MLTLDIIVEIRSYQHFAFASLIGFNPWRLKDTERHWKRFCARQHIC